MLTVRPKGIATRTSSTACAARIGDVPQRPTQQQREAAGGRDAHPLDDTFAHLVDEAEADEGGAEQAQLDDEPGHEQVEGG